MNPTREEALFAAALEQAPADRAVFLNGACLGDAALRKRVEALLAAHEATANPLHTAAGSAPTLKLDLAVEPDDAVGQTLGRYKLLEKVGEGGCGVVYVAEQKEPVRRKVALKVIKLGMDTKQVVARFEAERQALAMMDHPNIAKVLDAGTTEMGRPFFVMELVRGVRITDYCDQASLSTRDRLDLFIKVCHAIQHAHQKGIIHRDIKPSNILVTLHDGVAVPKVIDFGIAKATQGDLTDKTIHTQLQQFIGTPAYMSPEQAEMSGLDIDTRSDIYSLGVLLYELLAGGTPFDGRELMASGIDAMRKTIREKEPQRPSTRLATLGAADQTTTAKRRSADTSKLLHQLKGDLDWIVMKCLEKDRQRRYDTANGLAADIQRHLDNEPVTARPPSTAYRLQKAFRRNRLVFAAGTAVAIALIAGLCVAALGWRQTRVERDNALQARKEAQASERRAIESGRRAEAGELEARRRAYVADMVLGLQAASQGNLGRVRMLLDRYRPKPGETDFRGFEWRYLWNQARSDEAASIRGSVDEEETIGGEVALSADGLYLAMASPGGLEVRSFRNRSLILTLTNASPFGVQFSPDSQRLLAFAADGLALWNTRTWQREASMPEARYPFVFALNGEAVVARLTNHLALWSVQDSRKIADLPGTNAFRGDTWQAMAVSPAGDRLFLADSGGDRHQLRVWNLRTRTELEPLGLSSGRQVLALALSPQGLLAVAQLDGTVTLLDTTTRQPVHTFKDHLSMVHALAFSGDGAMLATGGEDQNIRLYDVGSKRLLRRCKGHEGGVSRLGFSGDGRWLVSGSFEDRSVRIWHVTGSAQATTHTVTLPPESAGARFFDSNRSVITWTPGGYMRIDVVTGAIHPLKLAAANGTNPIKDSETLLLLSPDETKVMLRNRDGSDLRVLSLTNGAEEITLMTDSQMKVSRTLFSGDGKHLIAVGKGWKARVWSTADWSVRTLEESDSTNVTDLVTSRDGSRLAQRDATGVQVMDLASGRSLLRIKEESPINMDLSPDGTQLVLGDQRKLIQVWDVARGDRIGTLRGHLTPAFGLSFSPDGKTLASCDDSRVKLWNVQNQQEIVTLPGTSRLLRVVQFSSDGTLLASRSLDNQMQFWRAPGFGEIAAAEALSESNARKP